MHSSQCDREWPWTQYMSSPFFEFWFEGYYNQRTPDSSLNLIRSLLNWILTGSWLRWWNTVGWAVSSESAWPLPVSLLRVLKKIISTKHNTKEKWSEHWKRKVEPKWLQGGAVFMSTGWPPFRYRFSTTLQSGTIFSQTWLIRKKWLHL